MRLQNKNILRGALVLFLAVVFFLFQNFTASTDLISGCISGVNSSNQPIYRCLDRPYPTGILGGVNPNYDLYLPQDFRLSSGKKYPLVIHVHGGGWNGDKSSETNGSESMAASGFIVANINYTTAYKRWDSSFNATLDISSFVDLVFNPSIANEYRIDTSKVFLTGTSAGGHLALMEATRGKHQFYFVGVGSAPTHIDQMPNPEDPNFSQLLDQVFGGQNFRSEMSPYNRVGRLNAKYFFMEHSRTDTLVPFNHALQFYEAANASQKKYPFNLVAGNPASKDPTNGLIIGSHNFSSGSVLNSMLLQALKEGQPALINFSKSAPQPKKRCRFAWLCSS